MEPKKLKIKPTEVVVHLDNAGLKRLEEMVRSFRTGSLATLEITSETEKIVFKKI